MTGQWNLVASHGTVLFYLATHEEATIRQVAHDIDLTERRVSQIIHDLSQSDILIVERRGRRNSYRVNPHAPFENPLQEVPMGKVVSLVRDAHQRKESGQS